MTDRRWAAFIADVAAAVEEAAEEVFFRGTGQGGWGDAAEDAYTLTFEVRNPVERQRLLRRLGELRITYQQDAIAFIDGETYLV